MIAFFYLFSFSALAFNQLSLTEELYQEVKSLKEKFPNQKAKAKPFYDDDLKKIIIEDKKNRVSNDFKTNSFFKARTSFWIDVYSRFSSEQVLIHNKKDLSILYDIQDYSFIKSDNLVLKSYVQNDYATENVRSFKKALQNVDNEELHQIRIQTGQRGSILKSFKRSIPYLSFLEHYLGYFEIPEEILALAIVESNFQTDSVSRTGATGLWQIMSLTAKAIMPLNDSIDSRLNPYISTIAAFHLLKQNYRILKRWDLAVTAYHSGTRHLLQAIREIKGSHEVSLENIFKYYESDYHGFASRNYYTEFLALAYLIDYKDLIWGIKKNHLGKNAIKFYVSKCPLKPFLFFRKYGEHLSKFNQHLLDRTQRYQPGLLLVSNKELPKSKYYLLSDEQLRRNFPINYQKFIKNSKCQ